MSAKLTEYLDFDLQISRTESGLRARVLNSPSGVASVDFALPFTETEIENFLLRMGRNRRGMRRLESSQMEQAKIFGGQLFETVFQNDVLSCYRSSLNEALRKDAGLRVRLRLSDAPDLIDLPWEYLYNPAVNRFISLSVNTPLVRYLDLPGRARPLMVKLPLHMLVMISSPSNYEQLDVEQEWHNLNAALSELSDHKLVVVDRCSPTLAGLQKQLRKRNYHIFHFIGHGGFDAHLDDGVLVLEDDNGKSREISGQYLGMLLHDERTLRLAVVNACEGGRTSRRDYFAGVGQSLLQQGIPAVIAMQFEISDPAAITLSREFYTSLAAGYGVDAALSEARKSILVNNNDVEWGTPVLYTSMPNGQIFDVELTQSETDGIPPTINTIIKDAEEPSVSTPLLDRQGWHMRRIEQLAQEGHDAIIAEEWDEAIDKLTMLLELEPMYKAAHDSLEEARTQQMLAKLYANGEEHLVNERWTDALVCFTQIAETVPYYRNVNRLITETEQKETKQQVKFQSVQIETLLADAQSAIDDEEWDQAEKTLEAILEIEPNHTKASEELAKIKDKRFEQKEKQKSKDAGGILLNAYAALHAEKWDEAIEKFNAVLAIQPDKTLASEGIENVETLRERSKRYSEALVLKVQGSTEKALQIFTEIAEEDPNYKEVAEYVQTLGQTLGKDTSEAEESPADPLITGSSESFSAQERLDRATWIWILVSGAGLAATLLYAGPAEGLRINFPQPYFSTWVSVTVLVVLAITLQSNSKTKLYNSETRFAEFMNPILLYLMFGIVPLFAGNALSESNMPWGHIFLGTSVSSGLVGAAATGFRMRVMYQLSFRRNHIFLLMVGWSLIALIMWFISAIIPITPTYWQIVTLDGYSKNFSHADFDWANLDHSYLAGAKLQGASLYSASLKGTDLGNADLSSISGRYIDFDNAHLYNTNMSGASLRYGSFSGSSINNVNFTNADLKYVNFWIRDLGNSNFSGANVENTDFRIADLAEATFSLARYNASTEWPEDFEYTTVGALGPGTILQNVNISNTELVDVFLTDAQLEDVTLSNSDLRESNFVGAELINVALDGSNLWKANFTNAELNRVDFSNAVLSGAIFLTATLSNIDMQDTFLFGTVMSNTVLSKVDLTNSLYDYDTAWPKGFNYENSGALGPNAQLTEVNLQEKVLRSFILNNADMTYANLADTQLGYNGGSSYSDNRNSPANGDDWRPAGLFHGTNLRGANLLNAVIYDVDFKDAVLVNANFSNAKITDSNFVDADLTHIILSGATYDDETIWPEGFDPEAAGATLIED